MKTKRFLSGLLLLIINSISFGVAVDRVSLGFIYGISDGKNLVDRTNGAINQVSPTCLNLDNKGNLIVTDELTKDFVDSMHEKDIIVTPFLSNHWVRSKGRMAIANMENLTNQILQVVSDYDLDGINVDIENLTPEDRDGLTDLVRLLRSKLPEYKMLTVSVAANSKWSTDGWQGSYDYKALGEVSDYLFIMAYDEHSIGGAEGPVASFGFVDNSIIYALEQVPKDKIVLGLPLYGRYWKAGEEYGGEAVVNGALPSLIKKTNAKVEYDKDNGQAVARFTILPDQEEEIKINGTVLTSGDYTIWFDDEESVNAKLDLVNMYDLLGCGFWALGHEKPVFWNGFKEKLNRIPREIEEPEKVDEKAQMYEAIQVTIVNVNDAINKEEIKIENIIENSMVLDDIDLTEKKAEVPHKHEVFFEGVEYNSTTETLDRKNSKKKLRNKFDIKVSMIQDKHFKRLKKKY